MRYVSSQPTGCAAGSLWQKTNHRDTHNAFSLFCDSCRVPGGRRGTTGRTAETRRRRGGSCAGYGPLAPKRSSDGRARDEGDEPVLPLDICGRSRWTWGPSTLFGGANFFRDIGPRVAPVDLLLRAGELGYHLRNTSGYAE